MIVWRIEHRWLRSWKSGGPLGPYTFPLHDINLRYQTDTTDCAIGHAVLAAQRWSAKHGSGRPGRHPTPDQDGCAIVTDGQVCGFARKRDIPRWFGPRELSDLYSVGYGIAKYRARGATVGRHQLVFPLHRADLIERQLIPDAWMQSRRSPVRGCS